MSLKFVIGALIVALGAFALWNNSEAPPTVRGVSAPLSSSQRRPPRHSAPRTEVREISGRAVRRAGSSQCADAQWTVQYDGGVAESGRVGADGCFQLELHGPAVLRLQAPRCIGRSIDLTKTDRTSVELGDVPLEPGATICVESRGEKDERLPSDVFVYATASDPTSIIADRQMAARGERPRARGFARADDDLGARILDVPVGRWCVECVHGAVRGVGLVVIDGKHDPVVARVVLHDARVVEGVVRNVPADERMLVVAVPVSALASCDASVRSCTAAVEVSGAFRLPLCESGDWFVGCRTAASGVRRWRRVSQVDGGVVDVDAGAGDADVAATTIVGTIVDSLGSVPLGARVSAHYEFGNETGPTAAETACDPGGHFALEGLFPGRYHVVANLSALGPELSRCAGDGVYHVEPGARDVVLIVPTGLCISGRVIDETGRPVARAILDARIASRSSQGDGSDTGASAGGDPMAAAGGATTQTDPNGQFMVCQLTPGLYRLQLRSAGLGVMRVLRDRSEVNAGSTNLTLVAERGSELRGRVKGCEKLAGDVVVCAKQETDLTFIIRARVSDDGTFTLSGMEAGQRIQLSAASRHRWSNVAAAVAGQADEIVLEIDPGVACEGRLEYPDGRPYASRAIWLKSEGTTDFLRTRTDDRGRFSRWDWEDPRAPVEIWEGDADGRGPKRSIGQVVPIDGERTVIVPTASTVAGGASKQGGDR